MSETAVLHNDLDVSSKGSAESAAAEKGRPPAPSLCRYALAAIAAQLDPELLDTEPAVEWRCLLDAERAVGARLGNWATTLPEYLARPSRSDRCLIRVGHELGLSVLELLAVACAAAVEDDLLVGRVIARVQSPLGGSRPTFGLLATAFGAGLPTPPRDRPQVSPRSPGEFLDHTAPAHALATGNAVTSGLLTLLDDGAPLVERPVRVPLHLCLALRDRDGVVPDATIGVVGVSRVPLSPSLVEEAQHHAGGLVSTPRALAIRTTSPSEGMAAADVIAQHLGRRPLFIRSTSIVPGMSPWLLLRGLLPVFCLDLQPGDVCRLPPLPFYDGPVLAIIGPDGGVETASGTALNWTIPVPPALERQALWQQAVGDAALAADLARHHRHRCGRIAHLGRLARHHSALSGRAQPDEADVLAASWGIEGGGLDALAQPLPDPISDAALVLTPALRRDLETLLMRCHARDGLADGLGASAAARYRPGVRALFVGPSGTGKTLAAGWLATKLSLPLYRVDLAAITSKYIGETEKNLAQLFARAEQAEVVLLFDEADSLFGKRTEVQQANDRFANAQTNYLLQRIESFDGITILTSNSRSRFDAAFARRLDMIVEFPDHGPSERRALWQSHLGERHGLSPQDVNRLAATADLVGGHIRNAVLTAAVLARAGGRDVELADLVEGLGHEYRKLARALPMELKQCGRNGTE